MQFSTVNLVPGSRPRLAASNKVPYLRQSVMLPGQLRLQLGGINRLILNNLMSVKLNFDLQSLDPLASTGQTLALTHPWTIFRPRHASFELLGRIFLQDLRSNKNLQLVKSYQQLLARRSSHMASSLSARLKSLLTQIEQEGDQESEVLQRDSYLLVALNCYVKRHALYDVIEHLINSDLQPEFFVVQQVCKLFQVRVQVFNKGTRQVFNEAAARTAVIIDSLQGLFAATQYHIFIDDAHQEEKEVQSSEIDISQVKSDAESQALEKELTKENAYQLEQDLPDLQEIECPLGCLQDSLEEVEMEMSPKEDNQLENLLFEQTETSRSTNQSTLYMPAAPQRKTPRGYKPYKPVVFDFKLCRHCGLYISQGELCSRCFETERKASYKKLRQLSFGKREDQQQTNTSKQNKQNLNNLSERRGLRQQLKERTRVVHTCLPGNLTQRGNAR